MTTPVVTQPISGVISPGQSTTRVTTGDSIDPVQSNLFRAIADRLQEMGLGTLFSYTQNGDPQGWLWDTIVKGDFSSQDEVQTLLEQRPEYQDRFPAIFQLRDLASKGQAVQVPTPAEVVDYENSARDMMQRYGMPPEMYSDAIHDIQPLMVKGISATGLNTRIAVAWNRAANTDPYVKQAMREYFNTDTDAHLAAFFLDPNQTEAKLDQFSRAGAIGGTAERYGFQVSKDKAEELAGLGFDDQSTRQAAAQVGASNLYTNTISEQNTLTKEQGLEAQLGTDANDIKAVQTRVQERAAQSAGGRDSGGAVRTQTGYGVGSSQ